MNIITLILLSIIFISNIIYFHKEYFKIIKIFFSRFGDGDIIKLDNKIYNLAAQSKWFLMPLCLLIYCLLGTLLCIILSWVNLNNNQDYITLISILLPLNYSWNIGRFSDKCIERFIKTHLSIKELKSFENTQQCKDKLKELHQYLSIEEAEELNQFYFDDKNIPRNFDDKFKDKLLEIEYTNRKSFKNQ